jgi:hypothetical protein
MRLFVLLALAVVQGLALYGDQASTTVQQPLQPAPAPAEVKAEEKSTQILVS